MEFIIVDSLHFFSDNDDILELPTRRRHSSVILKICA